MDANLFTAIGQRDLVAVERLLRAGANIEARGANGVTPLMEAAEQGNTPALNLLLANGAEANKRDNQGETALTWAARGGWVHLVNQLAQLSNLKDKNHALFEAVRGGPVVLAMVETNLPTQPQTQPNQVVESWPATVESLLANGAELEARSEDGSTPLIEAAAYAQTDTFKLLMQKGARLNVTDKYGNTPLIAAACQCALATMNSAEEVIQILLASGADVNARNHDGRTALMLASGMQGDAAVLELLVANGADGRLKDKNGKTALALAKDSRREDKIRVLEKAYSGIH